MRKIILIFLAVLTVVIAAGDIYRIDQNTKILGWLNVQGNIYPIITDKYDLGTASLWWDSSWVYNGRFGWLRVDSGFTGTAIASYFRSDTIDTIFYNDDTLLLMPDRIRTNWGYIEHYNEVVGSDVDNVFLGSNNTAYRTQKTAADSNHIVDVIGIGFAAGDYDTLGTSDIFIGAYCASNMNGDNNVFMGCQAAHYLLNGDDNVGIGNYALYHSVVDTGYCNTTLGFKAGYNCKGDSNVLIGNCAGKDSTLRQVLWIDNRERDTALVFGRFDTRQFNINGRVNAETCSAAVYLNINTAVSRNDIVDSLNNANDTLTKPWYWLVGNNDTTRIDSTGILVSANDTIRIANFVGTGATYAFRFYDVASSAYKIYIHPLTGKIYLDGGIITTDATTGLSLTNKVFYPRFIVTKNNDKTDPDSIVVDSSGIKGYGTAIFSGHQHMAGGTQTTDTLVVLGAVTTDKLILQRKDTAVPGPTATGLSYKFLAADSFVVYCSVGDTTAMRVSGFDWLRFP